MNEELKYLLIKLDLELQDLFECLKDEEYSGAMFHMGALKTMLSWHMEKYNVKNLQNSDQNSEREQSNQGTLGKEAQTPQKPATGRTITLEGCGSHSDKCFSIDNLNSNSTAEPGRRQPSILDEVD